LILNNQKVILQFTVKVFIFSKKKIKIQFYNTILIKFTFNKIVAKE